MTFSKTSFCYYTEGHSAEFCVLFIVMLNVIMLSVFILGVIMLSVMVPMISIFLINWHTVLNSEFHSGHAWAGQAWARLIFLGKLESCFVHHSFCLVLFKSCTVRARFSPFIETQIFANLILFKSCFVHCSFCLVPFKSRTILPRSSLFRLKMNEINGAPSFTYRSCLGWFPNLNILMARHITRS
jgi:hypothetical protein